MSKAPIILFVYNRLSNTQSTIRALKGNVGSQESILYIYSDGYKDNKDKNSVLGVRKYIRTISGFKNIIILERNYNLGLAGSIIEGVTKVIKKYGRVIVLEDDIVTSRDFISFMNKLLDKYEKNKSIWHVSGWNYPLKTTSKNDVFVTPVMNCWGWGTWDDRWAHFSKDTDKVISDFSIWKIFKFNLYGVESFWRQIINNKKGVSDTWAIYWYATIFLNKGVCINPVNTLVSNIGHGDGATNTRSKNAYKDVINESKERSLEIESLKVNKVMFLKIQLSIILRRLKTVLRKVKVKVI